MPATPRTPGGAAPEEKPEAGADEELEYPDFLSKMKAVRAIVQPESVLRTH